MQPQKTINTNYEQCWWTETKCGFAAIGGSVFLIGSGIFAALGLLFFGGN